MSADISLHMQHRRIESIEITADNTTDTMSALELLRTGLIDTIRDFNSQTDTRVIQFLKGGDHDE